MAENILGVRGLTKSFQTPDGAVLAVDNISFEVERGGLFAFLGQNGAGKSTTINVLLGLLRPDIGSIVYGGGEDFSAFKPRIGAVFQNNILDDALTVEENLRLYARLYTGDKALAKSRTEAVIAAFNMGEFRKKRYGTLSGGQKRKAEVARSTLGEPELLFLDEPTTGLDPKTRREVWGVLREIRERKNMMVFLTTHYMEEVASADRVVIIDKGRIVCSGTPAELKAVYSSDKLHITPRDAGKLEKELTARALPFSKTADTYVVSVDGAQSSISLLGELRGNVLYYEVRRGSMDDVFLNAVGSAVKECD